jgi:hypothetical protein
MKGQRKGSERALPGGMRGKKHLCYTATHSTGKERKGAA